MSSVPCVYMVTECKVLPLPCVKKLVNWETERRGIKVQGAENHYEDQILRDAQSLKS